MSKYQLIIFDLDGVLVNTEEFYLNGVIKAFKEQGCEFDLEHGKKNFAGIAVPLLLEHFNNENSKPVNVAKFNSLLVEHIKDLHQHVTVMPHAEELIKNLQLPYCVASASSLERINEALTAVGLIKYFNNNMFSCDTYKKYKPDPAVYVNAALNMGFKSNQCLAIEDSAAGVSAATAANIDVIGLLAADYLQDHKLEHKKLLMEKGALTTKNSFQEVAEFIAVNS